MNKDLAYCIEVANEIDHINRGGCGLCALAMSRYLKQKNINVSFGLVHYYNDSCYFNNCDYVDKISDYLDVPNHVVIKFDGNYYDSNGKYVTTDKIIEIDSEDEILSIVNIDDWNQIFLRDGAIEHFETNFEIDLSDVEIFEIC